MVALYGLGAAAAAATAGAATFLPLPMASLAGPHRLTSGSSRPALASTGPPPPPPPPATHPLFGAGLPAAGAAVAPLAEDEEAAEPVRRSEAEGPPPLGTLALRFWCCWGGCGGGCVSGPVPAAGGAVRGAWPERAS